MREKRDLWGLSCFKLNVYDMTTLYSCFKDCGERYTEQEQLRSGIKWLLKQRVRDLQVHCEAVTIEAVSFTL